MPTKPLIYGAGGHAKVVIDALRLGNQSVRVVDDDPDKVGTSLLGVKVELTPAMEKLRAVHLAIGNNDIRRQLVISLAERIYSWFTVIHPDSTVANDTKLGNSVFVAAMAVVGPDVQIGTATIVNHGAVVDHDCKIGSYCHIAPNATLGGAVHLEDGVLIGSGAVVLPGLQIGENALIGAGAVVTTHVEARQTVIGRPAKSRS